MSAVGGKNVPTTYAIVLKDLRSELRTRYALNALVMFVVTTVAIILFALRGDQPTTTVLAGMFWVVVFFSAMSGLSRAFVSEEERGTTLTLQLIAPPTAVYFGKLFFNVLLTLTLVLGVTLVYTVVFPGFIINSMEIFVATVFLGSLRLDHHCSDHRKGQYPRNFVSCPLVSHSDCAAHDGHERHDQGPGRRTILGSRCRFYGIDFLCYGHDGWFLPAI